MASRFTVVYDACVLYPAPLRDLLMELAIIDLYRARWTNQIHDEWIRNVLKNRPDLKREQLERTKKLMNTHVRDCLIDDYESLISSLDLPDPDDRHVLAAAIKGQADVIVTFNLKDFPQDTLDNYGVEALHPDVFLCDIIDLATIEVARAANNCRQRLKNPPKSIEEYLDIILKQGLPNTVRLLSKYCCEI